MKRLELRAFLGCDFTTRPLKPVGLRARNTLKPWLIRQPQRAMSHLVTAEDGRRFKLLRFPASIVHRREEIEGRLRALAHHPAVPRLALADDHHLLVEWATGTTPRADDPHFARRLGESFAALYRVQQSARPRDEVVSTFVACVSELQQAGRLSPGSDARMAARLEAALPGTIPTSILCGDQTLANFVQCEDGSLFMIDPGSFQSALPIDLFFVGNDGLYDRIDRDAFHEGYGDAGGIEFPFLHAGPLAWMQAARQSSLRSRVLDRTSWLERRRKRNLERRVREGLEALQRVLD